MSGQYLSLDRARRLVLSNRWATAVAFGVIVVAFAGGALIGLAPVVTGALVAVVLAAGLGSLARRSRTRGRDHQWGGGVVLAHFVVVAVVGFGLMQLVPYGRAHSNPPAVSEPDWSSPRTRELMVNACFGCHSNEVDWPWYSNVAPISWAITSHVNGGRDKVNYSEFQIDRGDADKTIEEILERSMPPGYYTAFGLHPEANLSDAEIDELVAGLRATPGMAEDEDHEDDDRDDDDDDDRDDD